MANLIFENFKISAIATSVPKKVRKTTDLIDTYGEEIVNKIIKNVGVKQGHISDEKMTTSDLCEHAANNIIDNLKINRDEIDALIFVSQTPDYIAPSTACLLQHRLNLSNDCLSYDINLACSAFVYGISDALSYLQNQPNINSVLLLCGDTVSKHCSPLDRQLALLSYDAGSAILLEKDEESKNKAYLKLKTIGKGYRSLIVPYGGYRNRVGNHERYEREPGIIRSDYDGYMNGPDVFKFSITEVPKLIKQCRTEFGIDFVIDNHFFHQANTFILKNITKRLKINYENLPVSIDRYGNTGAASIPLTICDYYAKDKIQEINQIISVCGFGIGLSLGYGVIPLTNTKIFPISTCDSFYEDNIDNLHNETSKMVNTE